MTKTIVLIHGAWVTASSLETLRVFFTAQGYSVVLPSWPGLDRPVDALRKDRREIAKLSLGRIVNHYADIIASLPERPILVGHSYGGLVTQMLLDRGHGVAGVSIAPAPAAGIHPGPNALRSAFPVFAALGGWARALTMSRKQFAWSIANTLPLAEQGAIYDMVVVPAPGRIYYQSVFGLGSGIDWRNPDRAPLLLMAGGKDRTVEPGMVAQHFRKYERSPALTQMKVFPDLSHLLVTEPGWEDVAGYALSWIESLEGSTTKIATLKSVA